MNIEKITAFSERGNMVLAESGIKNPVAMKGGEVLLTDRFAAFLISSAELAEKAKGNNAEGMGGRMYASFTSDFNQKQADVSSFNTTIGDLVAWLRKDTESCPFCAGTGPCPSVALDDAEEQSPELDDANSLHYGWVGVSPIRRSRLDELLSYLELADDTKILVMSVMNERPATHSKTKVSPFYGAVWVKGPDFELFLAGLAEKTEAAPKFHLEGKFTTPEMKKAGKKKTTVAKPALAPTPTPKKAATPKKPAAAPAKQAAKKPVTKTKVVSKTPPKLTGSSLLDRALAKKAAGRKKK